ncbi:MAG: N-acetylmuramoyl-L-alanine amidase [Chloroflexi bacterium]|nr:N-acetylmuramoyl-L-alanine amidase [Chloroflexota bacterium]
MLPRLRALVLLAAALASLSLIRAPADVSAQSWPLEADVGLDPGHSRADVGASSGALREFELTLDIASRIVPLLEERGFRARLSRAGDEPLTAMSDPDPTERTRIEQTARIEAVGRVRAYVSIHFNGFSDPRLDGTETYYNQDNSGDEALRLAGALQRNVVGALWDGGYQARDRGVKSDLLAGKPYGHFFSLRGPMPSALVEGLFLTSQRDAVALGQDGIRQAMAVGYARGIAEYLGVPTPRPPAP